MKKRGIITAMLVVMALAAGSCGGARKLGLTTSPDIPAAQGTAKVSTTDDGNTQIDLEVKHLASPERVDGNARVYVVWVRGTEADAQDQSLGALKVDKDLKASLTAMTPLRSFELYITAEPSQSSAAPTGKTLLSTSVSMKK